MSSVSIRGGSAAAVSVLVVDDSRLYRDALAGLLREQPWVDRVETAPDGASTMRREVAFPPTVTLLNMATDESLVWLGALTRARARVVVIGVREAESDVVACAEAGSAGYVLRSDSLDSLCDVVQAVARGESICSPKTTSMLLRRVATLAAERRSDSGLGRLTAREAEILTLLEQGMANHEIAQRLSIEVRTVKNHVHAILSKLGVARRGQAAAWARGMHSPVGRVEGRRS
jgi:DNA-binding NarL/FixJ family response regulator